MARFVLGLIFLGLLYTPFHATAALAADNGQRILELEARSRDTNGRPVSTRILEKIQSGFAALLIAFMLYIAFFDTGDWLRSARAERAAPVVFAAPK